MKCAAKPNIHRITSKRYLVQLSSSNVQLAHLSGGASQHIASSIQNWRLTRVAFRLMMWLLRLICQSSTALSKKSGAMKESNFLQSIFVAMRYPSRYRALVQITTRSSGCEALSGILLGVAETTTFCYDLLDWNRHPCITSLPYCRPLTANISMTIAKSYVTNS